jgi:hypothetical protein
VATISFILFWNIVDFQFEHRTHVTGVCCQSYILAKISCQCQFAISFVFDCNGGLLDSVDHDKISIQVFLCSEENEKAHARVVIVLFDYSAHSDDLQCSISSQVYSSTRWEMVLEELPLAKLL